MLATADVVDEVRDLTPNPFPWWEGGPEWSELDGVLSPTPPFRCGKGGQNGGTRIEFLRIFIAGKYAEGRLVNGNVAEERQFVQDLAGAHYYGGQGVVGQGYR